MEILNCDKIQLIIYEIALNHIGKQQSFEFIYFRSFLYFQF